MASCCTTRVMVLHQTLPRCEGEGPPDYKEKGKNCKPLTLQEIKAEMEGSGAYTELFPEIFKLLDMLLALPVGTATVEQSFSQMKLVKTRPRSGISDCNLSRPMRIAIEGPELSAVYF